MASSLRQAAFSRQSTLVLWVKRRIFTFKCEYIENTLDDHLGVYHNFDGSDRSLHFKMETRQLKFCSALLSPSNVHCD
jgi:hypothetical protein